MYIDIHDIDTYTYAISWIIDTEIGFGYIIQYDATQGMSLYEEFCSNILKELYN